MFTENIINGHGRIMEEEERKEAGEGLFKDKEGNCGSQSDATRFILTVKKMCLKPWDEVAFGG